MTLFNRWAISGVGLIVSKRAWRKGPRRARVCRMPRLEGLEDRCLLSGQVAITEFPVSTAASDPLWITTGPDGNLWFTENGSDNIGRIDPTTHVITEFPIPTADSQPWGITAGPDGGIWFTESVGDKIGRIDPTTLAITEYPVPNALATPETITVGPDGNLWFTEPKIGGIGQIGRIDPTTHVITEFPVPTADARPIGLTVGPDRGIWFTEAHGDKIGRIDPTTDVITEFPVPTAGAWPIQITVGPDGNLWFTELNGNQIGRINPTTHTVTEFPVPTANSQPWGITAGPDGGIWFTENIGDIGRIDPTTHAITENPVPTANGQPFDITTGADGNLWFTDEAGNIGQAVVLAATSTQLSASPNPSAVGQQVTFTAVVSPQTGTAPPTGTVTFSIDGAAQPPVALAVVGGTDQASFSTSSLTLGQHTVTAVYNAQGNFTGSPSNAVTQVVLAATSTQLSALPNPSAVGQQVTFTAVVSPQTGTAPPTGTVTFSIDGVAQPPVALAVVGGADQASFSTSSLTLGQHTVTAVYTHRATSPAVPRTP